MVFNKYRQFCIIFIINKITYQATRDICDERKIYPLINITFTIVNSMYKYAISIDH